MRKKSIFVLGVILVFYLFDAYYINGLGTKTLSLLLFFLLFTYKIIQQRLVLHTKAFQVINTNLYLIMFLSIISIIFLLISQPAQLHLPLLLIKYSLEYTIILLCFSVYNVTLKDSLLIIMTAGILQITFIIIMFISPTIKNVYLDLLHVRTHVHAYYSFRMLGLTGMLNYSVSLTLASISLAIIFLANQYKKNYSVIFICYFLVALVSIFSSRSALVFHIYLALNVVLFGNIRWKFFVYLSITVTLGILLIFVAYERNAAVATLVDFSMEPLYRYFSEGSVRTGSSDGLISWYSNFNYELPLFGYGLYINDDGSYYQWIDAGYLRLFLYWGWIFGLMICVVYMIYYSTLMIQLRYWKKVLKDYKNFVVSISASLSFILFGMLKGMFLVEGYGFMIVLLIMTQGYLRDVKNGI